jgi:hypothetical protein
MGWLAHVLGTDSGSGPAYLAWSGAGSDLGEVAIIGGLASICRRHNCEVHGCWRLGRHATAAGHHVCRRHHPDGPLSHQDVLAAHLRHLRSRSPGGAGAKDS